MSVVCVDYKVKTPVEWEGKELLASNETVVGENKGLLANVGMSNGQVGGN